MIEMNQSLRQRRFWFYYAVTISDAMKKGAGLFLHQNDKIGRNICERIAIDNFCPACV